MKRSQSSHPQFQIPISTPPMGQTTPTNRNYPKPTATIECNIHGFSIRTLIWTIQLQQDAISPNGLRSTNPRKKTDKRGTWSYHSVDGWYLSTSPEHYRVHNCYVKTTQAERLTDTIQFKHKNITNPTISAHDKIMQALANCKATLKGMMNENPNQQMEELQTIVNNAHAHLNQRKETNLHQVPRVESWQVPRVDTNEPKQTPPRPLDNHTPNRTSDTPTA